MIALVTHLHHLLLLEDGRVCEFEEDPTIGLYWESLELFLKEYHEKNEPVMIEYLPKDRVRTCLGVRQILSDTFDRWEGYLKEDINTIRKKGIEKTWIYRVFPKRYRLFLTIDMCQDFLKILPVVKRRALGKEFYQLQCRAEELLLDWTVKLGHMHKLCSKPEFDEKLDLFWVDILDDTDFQLLYEEKEEDELVPLDVGPLSPDSWFLFKYY